MRFLVEMYHNHSKQKKDDNKRKRDKEESKLESCSWWKSKKRENALVSVLYFLKLSPM
jgi:hypothetical protein